MRWVGMAVVTSQHPEMQTAREKLAGRRVCEVHHSLANTPDKQTQSSEVGRRMAGASGLPVTTPAERPATYGLAAEWTGLEANSMRRRIAATRPFRRRPGEPRAAVWVGIEVGAELDQPLDRRDAVALRGPHQRLIEDLL
jgi:hypothetical protein